MRTISSLFVLCIVSFSSWGCRKTSVPADGETESGIGTTGDTGTGSGAIPGTHSPEGGTHATTGSEPETGGPSSPVTESDTPGDSDTVVHTEQEPVAATVTETDTAKTSTGTDSEKVPTSSITEPMEDKETCRVFDFESPALDAGASLDVGPALDLAPGISLGPYREIHEDSPHIMEMSEWCLQGQWLNGGPIQIDLDEALEPPVSVAVEVHMSIGPFAYLRLLNREGEEVGLDQKRMNPNLWPTCIPRGVAEADGLLTTIPLVVHADEPVSTIIVAYTPVPINWGYAVYLDNLTMRAANLPGDDACPWNDDGEIEDTVPRCELGEDEELRARYLCHNKPDTVDSCEACDVECLQQIVRDADIQINECMTFPDEIICGPNPNTEKCCYIVHAHNDWCVD